MGIKNSAKNLKLLSETAGVPCFETLGGTPSVPGARWKAALETAIKDCGIETMICEAMEPRVSGGKVVSIKCGGAEVEGVSFILATGKFIGGGIRRKDIFSETLFWLDATVHGTSKNQFIGELVDKDIRCGHPAFDAGIQVNEKLQPLNEYGELVYSNLFAAGSVIGNSRPIAGMTGLCKALVTACIAAEQAK